MTRADTTHHRTQAGSGGTTADRSPAGRTAAGQHTHDQPREQAGDVAPTKHEQAARSVMHPDGFDPEWRYYHGAWGG